MNSTSGQPSTTRQLMLKITPECGAISKRIFTLNAISVVFALLAVILLIVALVYIYMPGTEAELTKNRSTAGVTAIFALLAIVVSLLISAWHLMISGKLKSCIEATN